MPSPHDFANAIRVLSMDAVELAQSGHPGMPMGMADIAEVLWRDFLVHSPQNPHFTNRDRFVLSNGHGSMLLYSLLHLSGYDLCMTDLKQFRQLHSRTPGHPEYGLTPGVETTTGPLGQGLANAVGMALAERKLSAEFNKPGFNLFDHFTYVFAGDGCLMEGISHEVCSLAGTHQLGKLIVFYDDNSISIDGSTAHWFTDNTPERFRSYGWQVIADVDGHNREQIKAAISLARSNLTQPTLICCKTVIGFGSPQLAGSEKTHGAPLGKAEIEAVRKQLNWPYAPFEIPDAIYAGWDAKEVGGIREAEWQTLFQAYQQQYPELGADVLRRLAGQLPADWMTKAATLIADCDQKAAVMATRKASQVCLTALSDGLPELVGGSADLTHSNLTWTPHSVAMTPESPAGNYLFYGVREFGMSAIMNGMALHGGVIPYGGTFLVFSDYARNAVRLSALMRLPVIFVYTHDSIGLGEDGPTHQPIEHLAMLRMTPNLQVWRPCDTVETAVAWTQAIEKRAPVALALSRQNLPHQVRETEQIADIAKGGYILKDCVKTPDAIIMATGSEVVLAIAAHAELTAQGLAVRVVSMPCTEQFDAQDRAYRESVLPGSITRRVAVEAASQDYWYKYVGLTGKIIGLNRFGESAPAEKVYEYLGITSAAVVKAVRDLMESGT
jgi:transketolase